MNIVLVGFMGTGKTTMGKRLAKRLGYYFIDMDSQIEIEQKSKISEIFTEHGEPYFRKLETQLLHHLLSVKNTIISTGGGVVGNSENMIVMKQIGKVIYLDTPIEEILERLKRTKNRPLLNAENPDEKAVLLLEQRAPLYKQADKIIETQGLNPHQITSQIISCL